MENALAPVPRPLLRLNDRSDDASSAWPLQRHEEDEVIEAESRVEQPSPRRGASLWMLYHYVDEVLTTAVRDAEIQAQGF